MLKLLLLTALSANVMAVSPTTGTGTQTSQEYVSKSTSTHSTASSDSSENSSFISSIESNDYNTSATSTYANTNSYTSNANTNSMYSSDTINKINDNSAYSVASYDSSNFNSYESSSENMSSDSSTSYISNSNDDVVPSVLTPPASVATQPDFHCTICKKPNERWEKCPDDTCRPKTCNDLGYDVACPGVGPNGQCNGKPACICIDGYVRDDKGDCIPKKQCPSCRGDTNAVSGCGGYCTTRCPGHNRDPQACSKICRVNACDCKPYYLYDENLQKCVRPKECTRICGANEVFDSCSNGGCYSARSCKDLDRNGTFICVDVFKCIPGCLCKEGYLKTDKGVCVPENKCPNTKCRGSNQTYVQCPTSQCDARTCDELGFNPLPCSNLDASTGTCPEKPACLCRNGYVKNSKGVCIPKEQCPACGGDTNAKPGCGVHCGTRCSDYNKNRTDVACIAICYPNACDCLPGLYYDDNTRKCVKPKDCTPTCGVNEVFSNCANGGCYSDRTCKDLDNNRPIICVDPIECKPGCLCKGGYLRDNQGFCVPENKCPNTKCPRANEIYVKCPSSRCEARTCDELGFNPLPCQNSDTGLLPYGTCTEKPACLCRSGYVKNSKGVCIPKDQCPSCGGDPNAVSGCGVNCGRTCSTYNKTGVVCPAICQLNGCDCREDYVFDYNLQKCVLPKDCTPICGANEVFDSCVNGGCYSARNCSDLDTLQGNTICVDPIKCKPGCLCKEGHLRNRKGVCVPENQCPNTKCPRANETYVKCDTSCAAKTCDQLGFPQPCPVQGPDGQCPGKSGCVCRSGFLKNSKGICVPVDQCPSCGGDPNAKSGCGINCGRRCSNYMKKPVVCPLLCILNGCDCKDGFVYDDNINKCVLPKDCTQTCGMNEKYSDCTNGGCFGARNCTEICAPVKCVKLDPKFCKKGCVCEDKYLRNRNGVCVPQDECELNEQCTGPNQFYDTCPPSCSPQTCASIGQNIECPIRPAVCIPACRCIDGYYTNSKGVCVPEEQCPKCPLNEVYSDCINGGCFGARNCTEKGRPKICVRLIEGACKQGCVCRDGYLRNAHGFCVPEDQCPSKNQTVCKANEDYDLCPAICPARQCGIDDRLVFCPKQPVVGDPNCPPPRCRCKSGFYNNTNGDCVTWDECSKCKKNEVLDLCPYPCPPRKCGIDDRAVLCAPGPKLGDPKCPAPACRCQDGFYRNDNGDCVTMEECPPLTPNCPKNEIYDECPGKCPPRVCGIDDRLIDCAPQPMKGDPKCPPPACRCKNGFYRNPDGKCVKWEQCPTCNKPNEVYDVCAAPCPPRRCDVDERLIKCKAPPQLGDPECIAGCRCDDGFVRNYEGICVTRDQCPQCTKPNEVYDPCPDTCDPNTCESIGKKYSCPAKIIGKPNCKPACRCKPGTYRTKLGDCVTKEQCLKCQKPNEYYSCGGACDNVCATLSQQNQTNCPIINIKCNEMCYCDKDFARDADGNCIPIKDCPKCSGPHEVLDDCAPTCPPQTCESLGKTYHCPLLPTVCRGISCRCEKGYLRNSSGICIPIKDCPPIPKCGLNQEYSACSQAICRHQDCKNKGQPVACPGIVAGGCIPGCVCKEGFLKNSTGICIPENQCPPTPKCRVNERLSTCVQGECRPLTCDQKGKNLPCPRIDPKFCKTECVCVEGYLKDNTGKCVKEDQCTPIPKCGVNQEYSSCSQAICRHQDCKNKGQPVACASIAAGGCIPGCVCKEGFLKNSTGICIPENQCPPTPKCGVNERLSTCVQGECRPLTCDQRGKNLPCPRIDPKFCKTECVCVEGYLKDNTGKCIKEDQCTQCTKPNEVYDRCPDTCDPNTCESIGKKYSCPAKIIGKPNCKPACRCKPGTYRTKLGDCVTKEQCLKCQKPNEYYSCGGACDNVCATLSQQNQTNCPIINIKCNEMCYCDKDFARDADGNCIPIKDCPPPIPKCGVNQEYSSCPQAICRHQYCKNKGEPVTCQCKTAGGCIPGCVCKEGFLKNSTGTCIPENQCPLTPKCGVNERLSTCVQGECRPLTCDQRGKNLPCPRIDPKFCKTECVCVEGYLKDNTGKCVKEDQCTQCTKPNEVYDRCPDTCDPNTCESIGKKYSCPAKIIGKPNCKPACRCKPGTYRTKLGDCVTKEQCLKCQKPNEYYSCGGACDNVCATLSQQNQTNCPIINKKCNEMCYCDKDFARDADGNCIPIKDCPPPIPKCGVNQEYSSCPQAICRHQYCKNKGEPVTCQCKTAGGCIPGCVCKEGFLKNSTGTCIPENQCPLTPKCRVNERLSTCVQGECRPLTCDQRGKNLPCPRIDPKFCKTECVCVEGYLKDNTGKCVKEDQCKCPGNGVWNPCPAQECDAENCPKSRDDPQACVSTKNCGQPRCTCGFNQKRDRKTKNCIAIADCPPFPCNGPNEEYKSCPPVCPGENCADYINNSTCPKYRIGIVVPCQPKCKCKKNFYRDTKGVCIPASQCVKDACGSTTSPVGNTTPVNVTQGLERLRTAINNFGINMLRETHKAKKEDNLIISGLSVQISFAQLVLGAAGKALQELLAVLNLSSVEEVRQVYKAFLETVKGSDGVIFDIAIGLFSNEKIALNVTYQAYSQNCLNATVQSIDCSNPQQASDQINKYVEDNTNGKIKDLIPSQFIYEDVLIVIVNALNFKGNWKMPFDKKNTQNQTFYKTKTETTQVPTMYMRAKIEYAEIPKLNAGIMRLRYENTNFSFVGILPKDIDGLEQTLACLDAATLREALDSLTYRDCKLWLPTFEIETSLGLNEILQALGIKEIFVPSSENLKGILNTSDELSVSAVVQKGYVKVDENGARAAVATGAIVSATSAMWPPPEVLEIQFDHPFPYFIFDDYTAIFAGILQT